MELFELSCVLLTLHVGDGNMVEGGINDCDSAGAPEKDELCGLAIASSCFLLLSLPPSIVDLVSSVF